jgi:flagellar hook-length control protein FliK
VQFADLTAPPTSDTKSKTEDLDPVARLAADPPAVGRAPQLSFPAKPADLPAAPPEVQFADANHDKIVTDVRTQLLPHGGAMQIRLDPPELGALKVMVEMRDGVMNATFETSNENATQLLSHSLNQLKHVLEGQGISVERLQVQQAPKSETPTPKDQEQQQQREQGDDHAARQEQQRKEMLRRMWRRVSGAGDPVDFLA